MSILSSYVFDPSHLKDGVIYAPNWATFDPRDHTPVALEHVLFAYFRVRTWRIVISGTRTGGSPESWNKTYDTNNTAYRFSSGGNIESIANHTVDERWLAHRVEHLYPQFPEVTSDYFAAGATGRFYMILGDNGSAGRMRSNPATLNKLKPLRGQEPTIECFFRHYVYVQKGTLTFATGAHGSPSQHHVGDFTMSMGDHDMVVPMFSSNAETTGSVTMTPLTYWSYGGKYNTSTGAMI